MNAHTPAAAFEATDTPAESATEAMTANGGPGGDPTNCPVAAIGRRLAPITDRIENLEHAVVREKANHGTADDHFELNELQDLLDSLIRDVEWLTPVSAEGALLTLSTLRRAATDSPDEDGEGFRAQRRSITRLYARLAEYLEAVAGTDYAALDLSYVSLDHDRVTAVARRHAA